MGRNILFVLGRYPNIGGVESITTNLSNEFVKLGNQVHIVSFEAVCSLNQMGLNDKVKTLTLSYPVYSQSNKKELTAYISENKIEVVMNNWCLPFYVSRLINYCIRNTPCKYLAIHQNDPVTNARLKNCEIRIEEHIGLNIVNKIQWHVINIVSRLSLKYVYHKCDRFVVLSPSFIPPLKKYIWEKNGAKISAIPEAFETEANGNKYEKEKEIIYLGRIDYNQKRVRRIIDIWSHLESIYPEWHLTIVGDGPDMGTVKKKVINYNLKNVRFEGYQKPDKYFKRASIMLLVSEYEGFGIVLVEAQSFGCVPIALDSYSALHDIVKDDVNGIIVEYPFQINRFVSEISSLIENKEKLEKCELNAIKSVDKFRLTNVVKMWLQLFDELNYESK